MKIQRITIPIESLLWGVVVTDPRTGETHAEFIAEAKALINERDMWKRTARRWAIAAAVFWGVVMYLVAAGAK